jgi:hypothetical protein
MADTTKPEIGQLLRRINEGATDSTTPLGDVMRLCLRLGRLLPRDAQRDADLVAVVGNCYWLANGGQKW